MLTPESVSVPLPTVTPPVPLMTPPKSPEALVKDRVLLPSVTPPAPESVLIDGLLDALEISNVPSAITPLEVAMLPEPASAKVPAEIVLSPV
jgi:hypothetical protein